MMGVCLRGNRENNLVQHREEDRNVFRAQAVGIGPTAEKCVHGATPTLPGCRKTKRFKKSAAKRLAMWWLPTRCSQNCSKKSGPSILSSLRSSLRFPRWQRRW